MVSKFPSFNKAREIIANAPNSTKLAFFENLSQINKFGIYGMILKKSDGISGNQLYYIVYEFKDPELSVCRKFNLPSDKRINVKGITEKEFRNILEELKDFFSYINLSKLGFPLLEDSMKEELEISPNDSIEIFVENKTKEYSYLIEDLKNNRPKDYFSFLLSLNNLVKNQDNKEFYIGQITKYLTADELVVERLNPAPGYGFAYFSLIIYKEKNGTYTFLSLRGIDTNSDFENLTLQPILTNIQTYTIGKTSIDKGKDPKESYILATDSFSDKYIITADNINKASSLKHDSRITNVKATTNDVLITSCFPSKSRTILFKGDIGKKTYTIIGLLDSVKGDQLAIENTFKISGDLYLAICYKLDDLLLNGEKNAKMYLGLQSAKYIYQGVKANICEVGYKPILQSSSFYPNVQGLIYVKTTDGMYTLFTKNNSASIPFGITSKFTQDSIVKIERMNGKELKIESYFDELTKKKILISDLYEVAKQRDTLYTLGNLEYSFYTP